MNWVMEWSTSRRRWAALIGCSLCWTAVAHPAQAAMNDEALQGLERLSGFERGCGGAPVAFTSKQQDYLPRARISGDL